MQDRRTQQTKNPQQRTVNSPPSHAKPRHATPRPTIHPRPFFLVLKNNGLVTHLIPLTWPTSHTTHSLLHRTAPTAPHHEPKPCNTPEDFGEKHGSLLPPLPPSLPPSFPPKGHDVPCSHIPRTRVCVVSSSLDWLAWRGTNKGI